jgi:hypothetical protein
MDGEKPSRCTMCKTVLYENKIKNDVILYLISVFPRCSVFFPIYGRKYAGEFSLWFFFVPYKVNIPMYAGGFKQVQYKEYICWIQVKIHISDQTSLRICNSVGTSVASSTYCTLDEEGSTRNQFGHRRTPLRRYWSCSCSLPLTPPRQGVRSG